MYSPPLICQTGVNTPCLLDLAPLRLLCTDEVAGLRRASPSAALDKSLHDMVLLLTSSLTML